MYKIIALLAIMLFTSPAFAGTLPQPVGAFNLISIVPNVSYSIGFEDYQSCFNAQTRQINTLMKWDGHDRNLTRYEDEVYCAPVKVVRQPLGWVSPLELAP